MKEADDQYSVRAVARAIDVLNAVADSDDPIGLTEIASRIELSVPTVFRLIRTLETAGLVIGSDGSKYTLGYQVLKLSHALTRQLDLPANARVFLSQARDRTGESVSVIKRAGDIYFHAAIAESTNPLRGVPSAGTPHPLYQSPAGRVILAFDTDEQIEAYLSRTTIDPYDPGSPVDVESLRALLRRVRDSDSDETVDDEGLAKIAVPVRGYDGSVAAAIYISGPSNRYKPDGEWLEAARHAASNLSDALGRRS